MKSGGITASEREYKHDLFVISVSNCNYTNHWWCHISLSVGWSFADLLYLDIIFRPYIHARTSKILLFHWQLLVHWPLSPSLYIHIQWLHCASRARNNFIYFWHTTPLFISILFLGFLVLGSCSSLPRMIGRYLYGSLVLLTPSYSLLVHYIMWQVKSNNLLDSFFSGKNLLHSGSRRWGDLVDLYLLQIGNKTSYLIYVLLLSLHQIEIPHLPDRKSVV